MSGITRERHRINPGVRLQVAVVFWLALSAAAFAENAAPPSDPRDISGIWYGTGWFDPVNRTFRPIDGGDPPYTDAARALFDARIAAEKAGHPLHPVGTECVPAALPVMRDKAPIQIIQTPGQVTVVAEAYHDIGIIRLNSQHPKNPVPTFGGDVVGHWEGDTLVVDAVGYRPDLWLDFMGVPAGARLHAVERIRKVTTPGGKVVLENLATITDPEHYTKPWTVRRIFLWRPAERITEEVCEEDNNVLTPERANAAEGK
jgi:hypothetical protein